VALSAATTPTRTPLGGDLNTRKTTRLTRLPERDQEPSLAPDQSWFTFASTRDTGRYSIWVQRVDSGDPIQVTRPSRGEDTTPRVFPDGRAIAFTRCETTNPHAPGCSVWSVAPLGGDERLLVPDCNLGDLHPRKASVVCIRGSATGVAFVEASLSGSTVVHPTWHGPVESLRVSTDGALLFLSSEQPWLLASGRTEPRPLFAGAVVVHTLAFAPGGDHAIFDFSRNGRRTLWAAPLADLPLAPESLVPLTVGNGVDQYPDLSADGQLLLYAHETHKSALYLVDSEGRSPQQLDTPTSFLSISLGGLGQQVVAWDADGPTPEAEIVVFDLPPPMVPERDAPTEPARPPLTRGIGRGAFPALSPDEASVALVDRGALVLIELATRRRTTLVASEVREVRPAFTPDGRAIVFASGGKQPGLAQIRAERPAEGQAPLRLASGIFAAPTFTPDALHLLASGTPEGSESSGLYLIDLRSAKPSPPRLLSPYRSYEAAPLILPGHPGLAWVLVDERSAPRLEPVPLGLHLELPRPTDLAFPRDPANWGVFDIAARPEGGFVFLLKRVYSDIMSVRASP
jgi:Tol biopolymer transport system component